MKVEFAALVVSAIAAVLSYLAIRKTNTIGDRMLKIEQDRRSDEVLAKSQRFHADLEVVQSGTNADVINYGPHKATQVRFVAWRQGIDRPEAEAPSDLRPDLREAVSLPTEPMKSPPGLMVFASFVPADTVYELEWYDGCDDSPHREGPKRIRPE